MQLPYGGISKAILQSSEHGPHPFMTRFTDRVAVSNNNENNNTPTQKSKLLSRLRRKNFQVQQEISF
jgi:hypothetical protein